MLSPSTPFGSATKEPLVDPCYHCGQSCGNTNFTIEAKSFCCYGCKTVYEILQENNLCDYYAYEATPGIRLNEEPDNSFAYLDDDLVKSELILYEINGVSRVQFSVPAVHCISCIWLLENLAKLNPAIFKSEVNFAKKTVLIDFDNSKITLGKVAAMLSSVGYRPSINLEKELNKPSYNSRLLIQLAVAGFCFGNIMMLSFPAYFGIDQQDFQLKSLFSFLNIALSLPVVIYCARDYFTSAWKSFRQQQINIDVPIAMGILVLFIRSCSDILMQTGLGYMDSLAGLVFFLLIGRWFQNKTYESLAFDRDYKSYFPLAVSRLIDQDWQPCLVRELKKGNQIRIRNNEIVPADCLLISDEGHFDYSFVTGESKSIKLKAGDLVYAGGKVVGQPLIMTVSKQTSQSHLTSLWNNDAFTKINATTYKTLIDRFAKVFTWSVLLVALPADCLLISDEGHFDYSFVTGESKSIKLKAGDLVYAGGKVVGQPLIMTVSKQTSQSHLTSLWNNDAFTKINATTYKTLIDRFAKVFTWSVLLVALLAGLYWYGQDSSRIWLTVTAVLMVACPCALALAAPFTYGNVLRAFGNHGVRCPVTANPNPNTL